MCMPTVYGSNSGYTQPQVFASKDEFITEQDDASAQSEPQIVPAVIANPCNNEINNRQGCVGLSSQY